MRPNGNGKLRDSALGVSRPWNITRAYVCTHKRHLIYLGDVKMYIMYVPLYMRDVALGVAGITYASQ